MIELIKKIIEWRRLHHNIPLRILKLGKVIERNGDIVKIRLNDPIVTDWGGKTTIYDFWIDINKK